MKRCYILSGSVCNCDTWNLVWGLNGDPDFVKQQNQLLIEMEKLKYIFAEKLAQASEEEQLQFPIRLCMQNVTDNETNVGETEMTVIFVPNKRGFGFSWSDGKIIPKTPPQMGVLSELLSESVDLFADQSGVGVRRIDADWWEIRRGALCCKFCIMFKAAVGDHLFCSSTGVQLYTFGDVMSELYNKPRGFVEMIRALKTVSKRTWDSHVSEPFHLDPRLFTSVLNETCLDEDWKRPIFRTIFSHALEFVRNNLESGESLPGKFGSPHNKDLLEAFRNNEEMKGKLLFWLNEWAQKDEKDLLADLQKHLK